MPEDGPVVQADGATIWYKNGIVHRDDGPAVELPNGTREWYSEGVRHRDDGPAALISPDGDRRWFEHGKELTESEFNDMRQRAINEIGEQFHKGTSRKTPISQALKLKENPNPDKDAATRVTAPIS